MSARTVASVSMIEKGLQRLYNNLENFDYEKYTKSFELYDTRCGKLSRHRTCKASKDVNGRILQVIWLGNEGGSETGDLLGCILPHKQAILVPQTRGFFATIAGSYHETST